jgi:hypothetical protein
MQNMSLENPHFCLVACAMRLPSGVLALIRCTTGGLGLRGANRFQVDEV